MKTKVYIIDDHALIRRGLAVLINGESDMEVCGEAGDAATALRSIMKIQPGLVIVDLSLGGNSGLELIKQIHAFDSKIRILVLSMHDESIYALRVLKAGALAYVMKQEVNHKVLDVIRRVRNGDLYMSDHVANQVLSRIASGELSEDVSPVATLSDRELEVVTLIGGGLATREIAQKLHVSVKTVETHRIHIKAKLNLGNIAQLQQFCIRWVGEEENRLDLVTSPAN